MALFGRDKSRQRVYSRLNLKFQGYLADKTAAGGISVAGAPGDCMSSPETACPQEDEDKDLPGSSGSPSLSSAMQRNTQSPGIAPN